MKKSRLLFVFFFLALSWAPLHGESDEDLAYQKGLELYKQGHYHRAVVFLLKAAHWKELAINGREYKEESVNWRTYQALGDAFLKLGDKKEALEAYEDSLDIYPDNPDLAKQVRQMKGLPEPTPTPTPVFEEVNPTPDQGLPGADDPKNTEVHDLPASLK